MSGSEASSFKREQVVSIINSVIGKVRDSQEPSRETIYRELSALKDTIDDLRHQLSAVRPTDIGNTHIPSATDELDAVVSTTEEATGAIMDSCEAIQKCLSDNPTAATPEIEAQVVRIFEACTFQDITGQRITKVVKTLKQIDDKVAHLLSALGGHLVAFDGAPAPRAPEPQAQGDRALLNGPQLPANAISQADIDKLLAEFDK